jgi:hypothetical protein
VPFYRCAKLGGDYPVECCAVYHVGKDGWTKVSGDDVGELHYKYYPVPDPKAEAQDANAAAEKDSSKMKD